MAAWRDRLVTFGDGVPANLQNLAETMGRIDERSTQRDADEAAEPDEIWVARPPALHRHRPYLGRRPYYRYPDRYIGPAAARQPNLLAPTPPTPRPPGPGLTL